MLELLGDLWLFMRERKKLWLAPVIILLLVVGLFIALSQSSVLAPLIYTLF
jgi:hypothetical protein